MPNISQLKLMLNKAQGYGYKSWFLFWTADIFSKQNISAWINVDIALLSWQNILVPDSLITFLRDRLEEEKRMKAISPGSVSKTADGEIILIKPDLEEVDGWERILKIAVNLNNEKLRIKRYWNFRFWRMHISAAFGI